jgi:hypothetical protein
MMKERRNRTNHSRGLLGKYSPTNTKKTASVDRNNSRISRG